MWSCAKIASLRTRRRRQIKGLIPREDHAQLIDVRLGAGLIHGQYCTEVCTLLQNPPLDFNGLRLLGLDMRHRLG